MFVNCLFQSILYLGFVFIIVLTTLRLFFVANKDLAQSAFADFCQKANDQATPEMKQIKCQILTNLGDKKQIIVAEIGAGPGNIFACWGDEQKEIVAKYIAVEPNPFFNERIKEAATNIQFTSPVEVVSSIEQLPDQSVDAVVMSHVLCSSADPIHLLHSISRILKPSGTFSFLEHISAPQNSFTWFAQQSLLAIGWSEFAGGCSFRESHIDLDLMREQQIFSKVNYEKMEAPLPFPFEPHLKGIAVK